MTHHRRGVPTRLERWANAVLLPCFDGLSAPEWVRRQIGESLGGVCLFARNVDTVEQVRALSDQLARERGSVVIAIDEEAGDVTRLDAATGSRFPGAAALGRADDIELTRQIAGEVGTLLADAGISINFAPCSDVAVDRNNPVIGSRAFGDDPDLVARHTAAWVTGQQAAGVAACAKHFPGHGDTDSDTHRSVAVLDASLQRIYAEALPPFTAAIDADALSMMCGHLLIPAVDDVPATVSSRWLTNILRDELQFRGALVTDALEMVGIAQAYGIPGGAVESLRAGADLLCIGGETRDEEEITTIRDAIVDAVIAGRLPERRLAEAAEHSATVGLEAVRTATTHPENAAEHSAAALDPPSLKITVGAGPVPSPPRAAAQVARHALQIAGPLPPLTDPVLTIRCDDIPNIAVGIVPWGPATMLNSGSREIPLSEGDSLPADALDHAGSILLVTRDRHRHLWMRELVRLVRTTHPHAIIVEMGISGVCASDAPAVASYGATLANTQAVIDTLREPTITA